MSDPSPTEEVQRTGLLGALGPGLITGASDDDPSGIATYSQVGAQFGYSMLWTMLFSYPLMAGIQETSADIGRVTGRGIAGNLVRFAPRPLAATLVFILVAANVINIGADIGAMAAAVRLLVGGPPLLWAAVLASGTLLLQVTVPYHRYVRVLRWLTLALFAYVGTALVAGVRWDRAIRATFSPEIRWSPEFASGFVAVLGTTISPYLFFWQASEEVEEERASPTEKPLRKAPEQAPYQLRRIMTDTYFGMGFSNLVAFFIILAVAATLNAKGVTDVQTAQQAAEALRPAAGPFAFALFTIGILGTGLLAVPVLAGSAAYAVGELFAWPVGLERRFGRARNFYLVLGGAVSLGLALNVANVNPIKALVWSAVINGVAAGPIMVALMLMATSRRIMGDLTVGLRQRILGWGATGAMLASAATLAWLYIRTLIGGAA